MYVTDQPTLSPARLAKRELRSYPVLCCKTGRGESDNWLHGAARTQLHCNPPSHQCYL